MAHDPVIFAAKKEEVDLIFISEPNVNIVTKKGYITDMKKDVAVYISNKNLEILKHREYEGYVKLEFAFYNMYCCYFSPNETFDHFHAQKMECVENSSKWRISGIVCTDTPTNR